MGTEAPQRVLVGPELAEVQPVAVDVVDPVAELAADGVVEILPAGAPEDVSYRLPADEPTSVVLHRLIEAATHSLELRGIIAAHLQHVRQQTLSMGTSAAA